jgi:hypothetical protein
MKGLFERTFTITRIELALLDPRRRDWIVSANTGIA